jgi:aminotransferase in exopolysaccharide biosynthesis
MSTNKRIYLSPPHMGGTEQKYVKEAFDTNWVAPLGANVDAFEEALSDYCKIKHAAALSSGTAAVHLALIILGIKPDDEVLASTFTFSATINPIAYMKAKPILIDSEPETWNMDPDLLEKAIRDGIAQGRKPKVIIPVHLYGMPANMGRIMEIAHKYEIPVIEDAAEALGSKYKGQQAGTFGKIGVLSFNGNKIITTSGGGALISNDKEIIEKARFLATQARDKALHYQHSQIGYNYRMSNILAGIGRGQMEVIEERVKKRRENFLFYKNNLSNIEGLTFLQEPDEAYYSNHWLTTILLDEKKIDINREQLQHEFEKRNIETRPLWKPMHLQPIFASCKKYLSGTSENLFNKGICLPSGSSMTEEDLNKVVGILKQCIHK